MARRTSILVVDDEPSIGKLLDRVFKQEGFGVITVSSGEHALSVINDQPIDMVILDLDMPGISGQEVCRRIRRDSRLDAVSILILTGQTTEGLTALCLDAGADDYVEKPFDNASLVARVRAILRRPRTLIPTDGVIQRGSLMIEPSSRKVAIDGVPITLAPKEFELLSQLVIHGPRVIDRNTLALKVWGVTIELLNSRTIDVHIRRIRMKLGPMAKFLKTIQSIGFQWDDAADVVRNPARVSA